MVIAQNGHWNTCVSRLYYACFYAVTALLNQRGLSARHHSGVRSLFNREVVRPHQVSTSLADLYNDLFEHRREADYVEYVRYSATLTEPWINQTRQFLEVMRRLIETDRAHASEDTDTP